MLTREYPPHVYGGAGVVVTALAHALARRMGVEVRCFGLREPATSSDVVVRGYTPWDRLAAGGDGPRFAPALEACSVGLAMARDATDADLVHAHTWYASLGAFLIRTLYGVPLVVTLHSLEPFRPWKADQLGTGYLLSTWAEKVAVEAADRVIAVSTAMGEDVRRHFAVEADRVVVVPNGIDAERYRRTAAADALARRGIRPPYVLAVGRLSEQKGFFPLLEAARALPAGVQVVVCASAPDTPEIEARFRAAVAAAPTVRWLPEVVPVDDLLQLYSHAAVFVCPSVYEPFGLINLEAMACETPVVATTVGGIPEVVEHGRTGLLVPPGAPAALAEAIGWVLAHPEEGRALGRAGRRRVDERFTWHRVAERTESVYREAIATFAAARAALPRV
jgi:glycogen synthase